MCTGIVSELQGIDLGDERLNQRSKVILEALSANPEASINAACMGWSDTLAAYRFFNNESVTPEEILRPHAEATLGRMQEQSVVLVVQDTTELDYTQHPADDAGCLNLENRLGLYLHTHLAVTPDKLCLGVVGTQCLERTPESLGQAKKRRKLPIEEKESLRWLAGYRLACGLAAQCPQTQIVSIADCEADIYDIFLEAQQQAGVRADYVIRAKEDRSTPERDPATGPRAYRKVRDEVSRSPLLLTRTLELGSTPKRAARQATLEIRAISVLVKPPERRPSLDCVSYHVVLVEEVGGPGDGTDVSWLLITTLPIETHDAILRVIDYYVARWAVEIYFRTLKTGCQVEEIRLETMARLKNCLAFYQIIAWRVLYLTYLNRTSPAVSCSAVFAESEWKSVWKVVKRKPLPKQPPLLSDMMRMLAELGGYNNRNKELPVGPQPIWIGIRRMTDFATAWLAFGPGSGTYV